MQDQETKTVTPEQRIASQAQNWRRFDKMAIADKKDPRAQREEYRARQHLRRVIDDAGER